MKYMLVALLGFSAALTVASCSSDEKAKEEKAPEVQARDPKGLKIAFYYTDSLQENYFYLHKEDSIFKKRGEAFQNELIRRENDLKARAGKYEEAYRARTASSEELMQWEAELQRGQSQLMNYQQTQGAKLEKEQAEAMEVIMKKIDVAAEKYCQKYGINILMKHGQGGQINYASKDMDVTESFIDFLNKEQDDLEKTIGKK